MNNLAFGSGTTWLCNLKGCNTGGFKQGSSAVESYQDARCLRWVLLPVDWAAWLALWSWWIMRKDGKWGETARRQGTRLSASDSKNCTTVPRDSCGWRHPTRRGGEWSRCGECCQSKEAKCHPPGPIYIDVYNLW